MFSFGGIEKFKHVFESKEIKEINILINSALDDIKNNNYEKASSKYKEVNSKFNKLEKKKKDLVKSSVIELVNKVNMLYINKLVNEANNFIWSDDKKNALSVYLKIQSLYKIIQKNYKAEVSKKCLELHKKISA